MKKTITDGLHQEFHCTVICPNCGRELVLKKEECNNFNTLGEFEAIMSVLIPGLLALLFNFAFLLISKRLSLECDFGTSMAVGIIPFFCLLAIVPHRVLRREQRKRQDLGYAIWRVSCTCENSFNIVRSTSMVALSTEKGNASSRNEDHNEGDST